MDVSVTELDRLVRHEAHRTGRCDECHIGRVQTKPVDDTGCNWRVAKIQGPGSAGCLLALLPHIAALAASYRLVSADGWPAP